MRQTSSFFFALPVDIYDAIYSSNRQYPMNKLREYALGKGLVVSPHLTREELCMRIAKLPFSFNEFNELSESLKPKSRKPKSEATNLSRSIPDLEIQTAIDALKKKYPNDKITLNKALTGTMMIKAEYDEFDHGQTRLKQRQPKEIMIEISASKDGETGKIISSATKHTQELVNSLVEAIELESKEAIVKQRINLANFSPKQINQFFIRLANSIPDIDFSTAKNVKVQRADNIVDEEETENTEGTLLTTINSASLSGDNILQSPQVLDFLQDDEYFIYILRWETEELHIPSIGSSKLLIEIKATLPSDNLDFQFDVLSYKHRIKASNEYVKNYSPLSHADKAPFISALHKRAFEVYQEVKDEISMA